jgi:hypothetical protein
MKSLFNDLRNGSHYVGSTRVFCFTFEGTAKDVTLYRHLLDGIVAKTETLNQKAGIQAKI